MVDILLEQLKLMVAPQKNNLRYSWETLLFCSLLYSIYAHSYIFLRNSGIMVVRSTKTLKNICSNFKTDEQNEAHFLQ